MAEEIGSAYLTIKPKMDDGFKSEAESSGGKSGSFFGSAFAVAAGELIAGAIAKLGSSLVDVFKTSFENYADFEQLSGGIEKLFGADAAKAVQENADRAFRAAGVSANEYMEQVTSFSASLISSLEGDTQTAANMADIAMRDMSDNANTFGTDIASIQNAYQGFAKGNFTMLDNLKLGYGGTKEEMQRLLTEAENLEGLMEGSLSIDNFADIVEAIDIVQRHMNISGLTAEQAAEMVASGALTQEEAFKRMGTTAREAQQTISGSITMLQASWQNFTTELGKDDADIGARAQELVDSFVSVVENVAPRLLTFAENLFAAIPTLIEKVQPYIDQFIQMASEFIEQHQPEIQAASEVMFEGVKNALGTMAQLAIQALIELIENLVRTFPEWYPQVQQAAFDLFMEVVSGFANGLTPFMDQINQNIQNGLDAVASFFGRFFNSGKEIIDNIVKGISSIGDNIKRAIEDPIGTAQRFIEDAMNTIERIVSGVHIELPHIPVPVFDVWGGEFPYGIGGMGDPPYFSIEWRGRGGFADQPTLTGYGERGLEMYWPGYSPYFEKYAKGIAEHMPASGVDIHDCTFNIRKESDIRAVAIELNTLINRQTAGGIA